MLQQELHRLHTFENWVIYIVYEVITTKGQILQGATEAKACNGI